MRALTCPRIPALLRISSEKNTVNRLRTDIKQLNLKLAQLQAMLEEKEAELCKLRRNDASLMEASTSQANISTSSITGKPFSSTYEDGMVPAEESHEISATAAPNISERELDHDANGSTSAKVLLESMPDKPDNGPNPTEFAVEDTTCDNAREMRREEEFPEVNADFQETFLGHTSPINRGRFSASGNNIASASVDGTVRIWTYDSSTPTSKNATIYCGAEIMSLDWDCKSDRLLLIGTAEGGIKAWNVDAKRVVCDLRTSEAFPSVLDLKCSPVEPIFVSAASSRRMLLYHIFMSGSTLEDATGMCPFAYFRYLGFGYTCRSGSNYIDKLGFASLTVWNMKTWKAMTVLPLGEDPPAITSLCFNHNGKILAAAATDGMIHMFVIGVEGGIAFKGKICYMLARRACAPVPSQSIKYSLTNPDMSAGLQITGWPAHDSAISSIFFGHDETSIFSFGIDGKASSDFGMESAESRSSPLVKKLQQVVILLDPLFCNLEKSKYYRNEMALDATGRRLLVTSGSVRAPIYQVKQKHSSPYLSFEVLQLPASFAVSEMIQGSMSGLRTLPHSAAITTVDWHPTMPIFLTGSADNSIRVSSIS
ncbi:WD40 repeat [Dillenia turbinata]|uniref:WD40 repeat n=1 Tax=Dillenia turbinata TaxID=194707 RepID=A0AAN8VE31_9MAGN